MISTTFRLGLILALFIFQLSFSKTRINGKVTTQNNQPLSGANVIISGTTIGTSTDFNENYNLATNTSIPLTVEVSYIGYKSQLIVVENTAALLIQLEEDSYFDEVIVSASRRAEKLQEAPAAVSVITRENINASSGSIAPIRALINTPGVE